MAIQTPYVPGEIARRGKALYEANIRDRVEHDHLGEYLAINVETGEWEMGVDHDDTIRQALDKYPKGGIYGMKIGYPATETVGGWLRPNRAILEVNHDVRSKDTSSDRRTN